MKFAYLGATAVVAALAVAAPASAEIYGALNAGAQTMKFDTTLPIDNASLVTVGGRIGWKANKSVGIEGDLFFGVKGDRIYNQPAVNVKVDSAAFIYGVTFVPASEKLDLIGRVGYGHLAAKIKGAGVSDNTNDGAVSYGVGAQYKLNAANGVRFDYTHYAIKDAPTDGFTVAYVRTF
jgi:hypothetical protein